LVDRIRFGEVVDFIDFRIWPVFNFADIAIVLGAAILFMIVWNMEGLSGSEG
ncbi:MAG: signal peptidase II, partial [Peptococcaceae bacterium]|nr:signal peptidase II [Peptococcaceae bacterium]